MAQRATIENFSQTAQIVKELGLSSCDGWDVDEWKEEGLKAFRRAIEDTMEVYTERSRLEAVDRGLLDRRNGYCERRILTVLGGTEVLVPRLRTTSAASVLNACARRTADIFTADNGRTGPGIETSDSLIC